MSVIKLMLRFSFVSNEIKEKKSNLSALNIVLEKFNDQSFLIIHMKKFLHFDWLRAVQFFSKTVKKRVNSVQKEETNQAF